MESKKINVSSLTELNKNELQEIEGGMCSLAILGLGLAIGALIYALTD